MTKQKFKAQLKETVDQVYEMASDKGLSIDQWAAKADLHWTTIERIASGKTRFPLYQTILAMAKAVGMDLYCVGKTPYRKRGAA